MWKFENIKTGITGGRPQYPVLKKYIIEKNINFIIARGNCRNLRCDDMAKGELDTLLYEFSACTGSMISWTGPKPSPPFLAVNIDQATQMARVSFLMDLTREAEDGQASPFYSKIMGALGTQFFAARPDMDKLWFPFILKDTVGRGVEREAGNTGMFLVRK